MRVVLSADIMPVYHLGDSQLFHFWGLNALSRKLRASLGFVWGRWGLPLPMQHDLISAISYPIRGENRIHLDNILCGRKRLCKQSQPCMQYPGLRDCKQP